MGVLINVSLLDQGCNRTTCGQCTFFCEQERFLCGFLVESMWKDWIGRFPAGFLLVKMASSPMTACKSPWQPIQGVTAGGAKTEPNTVYRSETGAGVGANVTPCPFNRTHEMISRRGTHSRIRECWGVVILPTALSPRTATQKSPQIDMT